MSTQQLLDRNSVNKPGTSCLGCRRRKLKCTREPEGCNNCVKSDLFCVYPTPESGVKRKRGPYKKDKPPRQRHLEDLVRYLEPRASSSANSDGGDRADGDEGSEGPSLEDADTTAGLNRSVSRLSTALTTAGSEGLVKDALIALTRSSNNDSEPRIDEGGYRPSTYTIATASPTTHPSSVTSNSTPHPPPRRIFEYWHLFTSRVDSMIKLIHCPTFGKKLFSLVDNININNIPPGTNALLFAIYYAAVSSCTAAETRRRFGDAQEVLLRRYGRSVEIAVGETADSPGLEVAQGLVLYMICIRHQIDRANLPYLFNLAVRAASHISLHHDPTSNFPPFEAELRRRLWHHLRGLENRTAEDASSRKEPSLLQTHVIPLPSNLNDNDLHPDMSVSPASRSGVTDMTFPLLRFEIHRLVFTLVSLKKKHKSSPSKTSNLREDQSVFYNSTVSHLQSTYLAHLDSDTRAYDWMCATLVQGLLLKAQLIIDFPDGLIPTPTTPPDKRFHLLRTSVSIIQLTHTLASPSLNALGKGCEDYVWFFRDFIQWHSLAIVIAELGQSRNEEFADAAWEVLGPLLQGWDIVVEEKRGSKEWGYVDGLIQRARARKADHKRSAKKGRKYVQGDETARRKDGRDGRDLAASEQSLTLLMPSKEPLPTRPATTTNHAPLPIPSQSHRNTAESHSRYLYEPLTAQQHYPATQDAYSPQYRHELQQQEQYQPYYQIPPQNYAVLPTTVPQPLPTTSFSPPPATQLLTPNTYALSAEPAYSSLASPTFGFSSMLDFADLDFSAFETVFRQGDFWSGGVG